MRMARGMAVLLLAAGTAVCDTDSSFHRFFIGWDHGVSLRYCPRPALGFGLLVQPSSLAPLYGSHDADHTTSYRDGDASVSSTSDTRKGATVLVEVLYRRRIGGRFHLTPFLSLGGEYTTQRHSFSSEYIIDGVPVSQNTSESETRTMGFVGQLGVMPGVQFGPVTIELRLGLGGEISSTDSPSGTTQTTEASEKYLYLVYPADLVGSLVLHIGLR